MAAVIKGDTYVFGIDSGAVTNAIMTSINFTSEYANKGDVLNEDGQIVHRRWDDLQSDGSATIQFTAASDRDLAASFDTLVYDSVTYYITEISESRTNNGFAEQSFNIKYVDYTTNIAEV